MYTVIGNDTGKLFIHYHHTFDKIIKVDLCNCLPCFNIVTEFDFIYHIFNLIAVIHV